MTAFDSSMVPQVAYTGPMWVYTAPPGSTIAGGWLSVSLHTPQGEAYVATPKNEYAQGDVLVNCQYNEPCGSGGVETATVPVVNPGGTQLFMAALCVGPFEGASTCPAGSGGGVNAEISLHAGDVELLSSSTPTATGFAGSLLVPAGASGTADLTFNAHDPDGPGVYRVIVTLDGTPVYQGSPDTNGGRCASIGVDPHGVSEFLYAQPCKQDVAVDAPVDTTRFANGPHELKVTVKDAASDTTVVYDARISVENPSLAAGGTTGPGSPLSERGPANGADASDQAKLTARWTRTSKTVLASSYGVLDRVTGRLTALGGRGISGASIDVYETSAYEGARTVRIAVRVRTGPTGGWTLTLPRDTSSSALRFAYRSHEKDTIPVATSTLALRVHAGIALRVAPRVTSVGRRIFFSGVLEGAPIPPGGKQLVLEASSGGEWVQFNTISTGAHGHFRANYRFKFPGPVTYRFRVLSPREADFPFLAGVSNMVVVREL